MLGLLLHQPHIEIYKALDPAAIHQAIHDHAERFSGGRVGGRLHKAVIELILDTGDEKLIAAIDPQWIKNIENDWTPRLRRVPMSRMPV
ncbi:MAG TPA: hypothetical protein VHB73_04445 [Alphaproteobacteria bacterium]|nr:hypothetical protein [Alphaproteobacteria bacterium]